MADQPGPADQTSGTDVRGARPLMERLMVFSLGDEIARLREEPAWQSGDRNSVTLAKESDFRVLLTVLRPGAQLEEQDGEGRLSVHLVEGRARLDSDGEEAELAAGDLATIDTDTPWRLEAQSESAVLTTLAWPGGPAEEN